MLRKTLTQKGFSLTEVLISLVIISILGGCAVAVMFIFINSSSQVDDYATTDMELENAVQNLAREFALIGLGMPNNRQALGSFALLHRVGNKNNWPAAAYFGDKDSQWGGPVTISGTPGGGLPEPVPVTPDAEGLYAGPELFYAWAAPTGVNAELDRPGVQVGTGDELTLKLITDGGVDKLKKMYWGTRAIDLSELGATSSGMSSWISLPTLRLPLFAEKLDGETLSVKAAPVTDDVIDAMTVSRTLMSLDEIHIMQAARLRMENGRLVRSVFDKGLAASDETLAENVAALQFAYSPADRLLSMFIALRGREAAAVGTGGITYPSWMPESAKLPANDPSLRFRIVAKTLTWRIRN